MAPRQIRRRKMNGKLRLFLTSNWSDRRALDSRMLFLAVLRNELIDEVVGFGRIEPAFEHLFRLELAGEADRLVIALQAEERRPLPRWKLLHDDFLAFFEIHFRTSPRRAA